MTNIEKLKQAMQAVVDETKSYDDMLSIIKQLSIDIYKEHKNVDTIDYCIYEDQADNLQFQSIIIQLLDRDETK